MRREKRGEGGSCGEVVVVKTTGQGLDNQSPIRASTGGKEQTQSVRVTSSSPGVSKEKQARASLIVPKWHRKGQVLAMGAPEHVQRGQRGQRGMSRGAKESMSRDPTQLVIHGR